MPTTQSEWEDVTLSEYHSGQICRPVVECRQLGRGRVHVRWHYADDSIRYGEPGHRYSHGEYTGTLAKASDMLRSIGIHTNDHRSRMP